jgi:hypothetical protein
MCVPPVITSYVDARSSGVARVGAPTRATASPAERRPRRSTTCSRSSGSCRQCQPPNRRCRWPADRPSPRGLGVGEILGLYKPNGSSNLGHGPDSAEPACRRLIVRACGMQRQSQPAAITVGHIHGTRILHSCTTMSIRGQETQRLTLGLAIHTSTSILTIHSRWRKRI